MRKQYDVGPSKESGSWQKDGHEPRDQPKSLVREPGDQPKSLVRGTDFDCCHPLVLKCHSVFIWDSVEGGP